MTLSIKKIVILFITIIIYNSCSTSPTVHSVLIEDFNTTITIHYKNEADKQFARFQQYDGFYLDTYGIIEPPSHVIESEKLKTVIKLNLNKPSLLLLGFNEFYIEPNNNFDIDFAVLKQTKAEYKDSIKINQGIGILVINNGEMLFVNNQFPDQVKSISSKAVMENLVSEKYLVTQADISLNKLYLKYPAFKDSIKIHDYFQEYFKQYYFFVLTANLNMALKNMSGSLKLLTISRTKKLSIELSKSLTQKSRKYWLGMKNIFEHIINPAFEKSDYNYQLIKPVIEEYDSITQQYFLLLSIKQGYILDVDDEGKNVLRKNNLKGLVNQISYPQFVPFIDKFKIGNANAEFINDDIKNCIVYDYTMQKVSFNELFTKSSQQYILFDFCGSWCKPCMEELKDYKISHKLDTSDIVKPIWIFFENNDREWLQVIKTYNLKKENCFLLKNDTTIQKNFGILFSWQGEFPHHFLFNKQGKIIDNNVSSLSSFKIDQITGNINK